MLLEFIKFFCVYGFQLPSPHHRVDFIFFFNSCGVWLISNLFFSNLCEVWIPYHTPWSWFYDFSIIFVKFNSFLKVFLFNLDRLPCFTPCPAQSTSVHWRGREIMCRSRVVILFRFASHSKQKGVHLKWGWEPLSSVPDGPLYVVHAPQSEQLRLKSEVGNWIRIERRISLFLRFPQLWAISTWKR